MPMSTTLAAAATATAAATDTTTLDTKSADVGTGNAKAAEGANATQVDAGADAAAKAAAELAAKPFTEVTQLKLADGLQLDEAVMKDFVPLAKELGFTAAQAQKLVEFNATLSKRSEEARVAAQDAAAKAAVEALKKDPEIGGAKFDASIKFAAAALQKFGGPVDPKTGKSAIVDALETMQLADGSMVGDHVVMAKFLANVGKAIAEDQVGANRSGGAVKTAANDPATFHAEMYPNSPQLKR